MPAMPTLLDFCSAEDFADLLTRAPALVRPVLTRNRRLPEPLVEGAFAAGEPGIAALLDARRIVERDPELRRRLAATGSPLVAEAICGEDDSGEAWSEREYELLFDSADPADPRWRAPAGAVTRLLQAEPDDEHGDRTLQEAALGSPFPDLVRHALRLWGGELERRELLRAVRALLLHGGPDALREVLDDPGLRSCFPEPVRDLAERALKSEEGAAELRAAAERADGTGDAVEELRAAEAEDADGVNAEWVEVRLEVRGGADWEVLAAAHRERPFCPAVSETLARRPDCPEELLAELVSGAPDPDRFLKRIDRPLPLRALAVLPRTVPTGLLRWAVFQARQRDLGQGAPEEGADWAAVGAAHRAEPLPEVLIEYLAGRPDCPDGLLTELVAAHGSPDEPAQRIDRPLPAAVLAALAGIVSPRVAAGLLARSLGRTLTAGELLDEVRPASAALQVGAALAAGDERARVEWDAFGGELAALLADTVGTDPAAWRALRRRVARARGTVAELLADAARNRGGTAGGPWPDAAGMPPVTKSRPYSQARTAFTALLGALPAEDQERMLDRVDDRTAHDLFTQGRWRDEWPERIRAGRRTRDAVALSRRPGLPAEAVRVLAELDDPAVNAGLLYQEAASREVRDALLAGVPLGPEHPDRSERLARSEHPGRPERLPLDPGFREELLKCGSWRWLYPVAGCGDPDVLDRMEAKELRMHRRSLRLRILLGLWERNGRDCSPRHEAFCTSLVPEADRAEDDEEAVELVRTAVAEEESAWKLVKRLRSSSWRLGRITAERFDWDWGVLLEAHLRSPFGLFWVKQLAALPDCPEPIRAGVGRMTKPEQRVWQRLAEGAPPEKALAKVELSWERGPERPWPLYALDRGVLTPADLVRHGRPVGTLLEFAGMDARVREALAEEMRPLDGRPEAWMLALQMLDGFQESLPTLVRTVLLVLGLEK
ncbi:hypothetical protein [Nocardiopsis potens]|uniref:hypothetical protein n=1 Tax=Nocardiopsis potens TaxID=1246458 RepID=UPI00034C0C2C|nr:hypothetical protein [Nocardiopsis potens]